MRLSNHQANRVLNLSLSLNSFNSLLRLLGLRAFPFGGRTRSPLWPCVVPFPSVELDKSTTRPQLPKDSWKALSQLKSTICVCVFTTFTCRTIKLSREVCNPVRFELQAVCWGFCSWSLSRWPTQFQPCPWWVECHILNGLCSSQLHGVQFDPLRVGWCQPVLQSTLFLSRIQINYSHIPLVLLIHKCWWGCQPAFAQPVLGLWCFNPGQKSEHVCDHSFCLMIQRMALNIASGPCFMYIHLISSTKQMQDMFDGSWNDFIPLVVVHICPEDWYVQYWRLIDFNLSTSGLCSITCLLRIWMSQIWIKALFFIMRLPTQQ